MTKCEFGAIFSRSFRLLYIVHGFVLKKEMKKGQKEQLKMASVFCIATRWLCSHGSIGFSLFRAEKLFAPSKVMWHNQWIRPNKAPPHLLYLQYPCIHVWVNANVCAQCAPRANQKVACYVWRIDFYVNSILLLLVPVFLLVPRQFFLASFYSPNTIAHERSWMRKTNNK